jgi:hypothetical protein
VSQSELSGTFFSLSMYPRYTAGFIADPGWLISVSWSICPATRGSEVHVGSMFGA